MAHSATKLPSVTGRYLLPPAVMKSATWYKVTVFSYRDVVLRHYADMQDFGRLDVICRSTRLPIQQ